MPTPRRLPTLTELANAVPPPPGAPPSPYMRPELARALLADQPGIEAELTPPISYKDLLAEPVLSFLQEANVEKYLPLLPLLGMVRYKRPGVSAAGREAAEKVHRAPVIDPIRERSVVFHATDPQSAERILKAGEIVPDPSELKLRGLETWQDLSRLRPIESHKPAPPELFAGLIELARKDPNVRRELNEMVAFRAYGTGLAMDQPHKIEEALEKWKANPESLGSPGRAGYQTVDFARSLWGKEADKVLASLGYSYPSSLGAGTAGVSVSRVPRVASKDTRAISFMIDPAKMPPSRPYAESGYEKTLGGAPWEVNEYGKPRMNPVFEFENRTFNQPIPASAIRELWVDKPAYLQRFLPGTDLEVKLQELRDLAGRYNLPVREFESGREMHRGRTTLFDLTRKKKK